MVKHHSFKMKALTLTNILLALLILIFVTPYARLIPFSWSGESRTPRPPTIMGVTATAPSPVASSPTAIPSPISSVHSYPPEKSTLAFNDALAAYSSQLWENDATTTWNDPHASPSCTIRNGAYYARSFTTNYGLLSNDHNGNFVYEIQMTITKGKQAGIVFRVDDQHQTYYSFQIESSGGYVLASSSDHSAVNIPRTPSSALHSGLNQRYLLAVVAIEQTLSFYINWQFIFSVQDNSYQQGALGVTTGNDISNPTEAFFNAANMWTF